MAKDNDEETLPAILAEIADQDTYTDYGTAPADEVPAMQKTPVSGKEGGGSGGEEFAQIAMKILPMLLAKDGGRLKPKAKKSKNKKKRVVRGVGAAKRGYGKATYSKRMY